jgi:murein DD-endopeptidase MepM/ murein hydrolase activator NlpD
MRVRVGAECWSGHAIDLRGVRERCGVELDAQRVAAAVRSDWSGVEFDAGSDDGGDEKTDVAIDCPDPGPVHEHVDVIRTGMAVRRRAALAAAARSRGRTAPQADELAAVRERLDALDAPEIDLRDARRRVADASDEETALRERVATLQGRVQALREVRGERSEERSDAESELAEATRRLSAVETERIAAEQALARARERAAANRERRRERLRLRDRADNLRRAAREYLAGTVREAFEDARDAVPAGATGESVGAALAVARVTELDAPVVLARNVGAFESVDAAARWLDAPVIRL